MTAWAWVPPTPKRDEFKNREEWEKKFKEWYSQLEEQIQQFQDVN